MDENKEEEKMEDMMNDASDTRHASSKKEDTKQKKESKSTKSEALRTKEKPKKETKAEKKGDKKKQLAKVEDPWETLKFVLMTEKCVRQIELKNEITFIARRGATKKDIADAFETVFETRVHHVKTVIDQKGRKKAYIRLAESGQAGEIAIKLGII